jgi:hypothetical protein
LPNALVAPTPEVVSREKLFESSKSKATVEASVSAVTSPRCPAVNVCAVLNTLELMVTVVPLTEVATLVPPVKVKVPLLVIAVPEPVSAAGVMLVTVPEPDGACQLQVPSPSSRRNFVPPDSPVDLTSVPSMST